MSKSRSSQQFRLRLDERPADTLVVTLSGNWRVRHELPTADEVEARLARNSRLRRLAFETSQLSDWDSALVSFVMGASEIATKREVEFDSANLPRGARRLLELARGMPETRDTQPKTRSGSLATTVGHHTLSAFGGLGETLGFVGEIALMIVRFFAGRANYRRSDFVLMVQESGARALPIITIISLLMGLILAFVGAVQLEQFGAGIYVADLVGIAMAREMGAVMTGIVMAGRTGAAFAAQIGAMQGNEEVDALTTLGLSPIDFLVLPRMLALILMMPLLCIYADLMGILGGWLVGVGMLNLTSVSYWIEIQQGVSLMDFAVGLSKSAVFGAIVATAGCLRGMQAERNAQGVGDAATSAVVTSILGIIVADACFAVLTNVLGI